MGKCLVQLVWWISYKKISNGVKPDNARDAMIFIAYTATAVYIQWPHFPFPVMCFVIIFSYGLYLYFSSQASMFHGLIYLQLIALKLI